VSVQLNEQPLTWQERRLLIQSMAATQAAQANLQERLQKAEHTLTQLAVRKQGKPRLTERGQVIEHIEALLKQFRVEGLLQVEIQEEVNEHPVRAYRGRLSPPRQQWSFQLGVSRVETAIAKAMSQLGWRVYATNVQRDDHRVGLVRLLTIALRVLTLLEGVVRQQLSRQQETLAGLFAGNPKRRTAQPTAERLLETFREITLTIVSAPGFVQRHVTPLSPLQQQIVALCGFSPVVYDRFADDS
jgi:hypothetical protein